MKRLFALLFILLLVSPNGFSQDQPVENDPPPGWWQIPKTSTQLKIGGYVKLDLIHDFKPIGSLYYFDVSKTVLEKVETFLSTHLNKTE